MTSILLTSYLVMFTTILSVRIFNFSTILLKYVVKNSAYWDPTKENVEAHQIFITIMHAKLWTNLG